MKYESLIIWMVLAFSFAFLALLLCSDLQDHPHTDCKEICTSNMELFYKQKLGGYQNKVCYCKDERGAISTYVM